MFWLLLAAALLLAISAVLNGLATWRGWLFIERMPIADASPYASPEVSLLVPVCGIEGEGTDHFARFSKIEWPHYQLVFAVLDPADPAIPILREIHSSEHCEVVLQIGGAAQAANLKVRNMVNAFPCLTHDWIVICDADVEPDGDFLKNLMNPFNEPGAEKEVGLVHSLYRGLNDPTLACSWENIWVNCDFWAQGLLGDWLRGTDFAFGAAMAFSRSTLGEIGGLEPIGHYLADDYQIGNRISKLGKRVVFNRRFVTLRSKAQGWGETWAHLLRWSRTIRACQPGGFAGSILTNVTLMALIALALSPSTFLEWSVGAICFRIACANQCRNWILDKQGIWSRCWLIPLKDLAQAFLWCLAFTNGSVEWRGQRYQLLEGGKLRLIPPSVEPCN